MQKNNSIGVCFTIFALITACADDGAPGDELADTGESGEFGESGPSDESGDDECDECSEPDVPVCGDMECDASEDCSSCAADCGACLDCSEAPSCAGAAIPGVIETHLDALDVPVAEADTQPLALAAKLGAAVHGGDPGVRMIAAALDRPTRGEHPLVPALRDVFARYPEQAAIVRRQLERAGMGDASGYRLRFPEPRASAEPRELASAPAAAPDACDPAKLRVRVAKLIVHEEHDLVQKDQVYCAIVSEAASGAEIKVTPTTPKLGDGEEHVYALAQGVVWGQAGEPTAPLGDMLITYNCLESDDTQAFQDFLEAIGDAALGADPIPGSYGWIVPVVGLAAEIIGAALALEGDDHLFNASQIIPAELQLEMTHGVWWSVERDGVKGPLQEWHWELRMEAWGCTSDGVGEEPTPVG